MTHIRSISDDMLEKYKRIIELSKRDLPIAHACKMVGITPQYFYRLRRKINTDNVLKATASE
jgi:hypothetical protein